MTKVSSGNTTKSTGYYGEQQLQLSPLEISNMSMEAHEAAVQQLNECGMY